MSPRFAIDLADLKSWSITTLLLIAAAAITIIGEQVTALELGPTWEAVAVAVTASLLKLVQKLLRGPVNEPL